MQIRAVGAESEILTNG